MRRPYDMLLIIKDVRKRYLHELDVNEIAAVADGWHDAIRAIRAVMPSIGREIAYNVVTHNGPGAGLYFEFLPYTQEIGGLEHLGLYICQGTPEDAARRLRALLNEQGEG
jgi:galactose-1-phosphate uridylyltransferase